MFSSGQWLFMAVFMVIFIVVITLSYRKDVKLHRKHYKGSRYVLIGFFLFIGFLFFLKYFLDF